MGYLTARSVSVNSVLKTVMNPDALSTTVFVVIRIKGKHFTERNQKCILKVSALMF